ncbi:uncharacterized protein BJ212DRAFT_231330 [Suillus subaureus]|uniref:Uncharacterized protein n=1 Tax=Suillus subaureus TaxID=48587 RepID=A0A9P7EA46_9AGAM|nr:uncharacterized protein BJ212DRAFT_231330 [Suillus subaureus]KAG1815640.1 hypothetical protein BJ212DRAFT_231330 [Suillus subaureus]
MPSSSGPSSPASSSPHSTSSLPTPYSFHPTHFSWLTRLIRTPTFVYATFRPRSLPLSGLTHPKNPKFLNSSATRRAVPRKPVILPVTSFTPRLQGPSPTTQRRDFFRYIRTVLPSRTSARRNDYPRDPLDVRLVHLFASHLTWRIFAVPCYISIAPQLLTLGAGNSFAHESLRELSVPTSTITHHTVPPPSHIKLVAHSYGPCISAYRRCSSCPR